MRFTVKYTTRTGETLTKDFDGGSEADVRRLVMQEGNFPLEVKRSSTGIRGGKTIGAPSMILFNQELLALLKAGIPLMQSLELLVGHGKDPLLRQALERVVELLKEGMSYSEALEQTGAFPPVYRANVVAGERSGTMNEVIARWLAFQAFSQKSKGRIIEAMIYPSFLVVVLVIAIAVIFNVVLPKFQELFVEGGTEMPAATQILMAIGTFVRSTIWWQAAALVILIFYIRWMMTTDAGKRTAERIILAIPKMGTLYRMYHSSVFCRTLGVLLAGGMPVLQSLEVLQRTTASERMRIKLVTVIDQIRSGSALYQSLDAAKILDPLAIEMTRVGEQSSALSDMLSHVADFFDQEVEKATAAVTGLIGPIMILMMGGMVMGLLLAIYVPLFSAGQTIR